MRLIAVRIYEVDDGEMAVDKLYRRGNVFALNESATAYDPGGWAVRNIEQAREWLSDCPEQLVEVREAV
jgi:hypothetical protein